MNKQAGGLRTVGFPSLGCFHIDQRGETNVLLDHHGFCFLFIASDILPIQCLFR